MFREPTRKLRVPRGVGRRHLHSQAGAVLHPLPLRRGARAPRLGWPSVLEDQGPVLAESRGPGRPAGPMSSKGRGCGWGTASFRVRAFQNMTGCALLPGKHVYSCWLQTLHQVTQKLLPCPSQGPLLWRGGCTSARRSTGGPRCSFVCPSSSCLGLAPSPAGRGHPGPRLQTKTAFHVLGMPWWPRSVFPEFPSTVPSEKCTGAKTKRHFSPHGS